VGHVRPLDIPRLHGEFRAAQPFPHVVIDDFLEPTFAREVAAAYPTFERALQVGTRFETEFEHLKVQITEPDQFPAPVRAVFDDLAAPEFLATLSQVTGIDKLLADPDVNGGGIHQTASGGRLDVHVDFNFVPDRGVFRRLNLLLFLNPRWLDEWGGMLELWDASVTRCARSITPVLNRCVVFATSSTSYHGVTQVRTPGGEVRNSFSAYYYTAKAPPGFDDDFHGTVFRRRPGEAR